MIIAAAGGAAHLAGVIAAHTTLAGAGRADDQRPERSGFALVYGANAGRYSRWHAGDWKGWALRMRRLLAIAILANGRPDLKKKLRAFRAEQEKKNPRNYTGLESTRADFSLMSDKLQLVEGSATN